MKKLVVLIAAVITLMTACKKSDSLPAAPAPTPLITNPGTPDGAPNSKTIGTAGGTLTSTDGKIKIQVPQGALTANTNITIQPITNNLPLGKGKAYRLTPHDITFAKPVTISFKYQDSDLTGTAASMLLVAYQEQNGGWLAYTETVLDAASKTIAATTTHFSDWGFFPSAYIDPQEARVSFKESLALTVKATTIFEEDYEGDEEQDWQAVQKPFEVPAFLVKKWNYAGTGTLVPNGARAAYMAPNKIGDPNPETVSVEFKVPKKNAFALLLSHITVTGELRIDHMQVDETEQSFGDTKYTSRLFIYGNFGDDPGETERSVNLRAGRVKVIAWTKKLIICDIPATGEASSGLVMVASKGAIASKFLNEWTITMNYEKVESPGGSLTKKVQLKIRIRGDATGSVPAEYRQLVPDTDLNKESKALIDMPVGAFSNVVSGDGCGTYAVRWDPVFATIARGKYGLGNDSLRARITHTETGFKIQIKFMTGDILKTHRKFTPCVGDANTNIVSEPISLSVFNEDEFELKFATQATRTYIRAGELPKQTGTGCASGLFFDFGDINLLDYTTRLWWADAVPKYE